MKLQVSPDLTMNEKMAITLLMHGHNCSDICTALKRRHNEVSRILSLLKRKYKAKSNTELALLFLITEYPVTKDCYGQKESAEETSNEVEKSEVTLDLPRGAC